MKNAIRSELRKALTNKMFYFAIAIGLMFWALDFLEQCRLIQEFDEKIMRRMDSELRYGRGHAGYSLFYMWSAFQPMSRGTVLFYTVWPVLAAMAYGWSYVQERRSGVYNQIAGRIGARAYYVAKYVAVFVSGGLAVALPVLLGLLANAMVVPYAEISSSFNLVGNRAFLSTLFYKNHWLYAMAWITMLGVMAGAAASLCFALGTMIRYAVMVILAPYALYVGVDALMNSLRIAGVVKTDYVVSPMQMMYAIPGWANPEWYLLLVVAGICTVSFAIGYWQVVKHELA